MRSPIRSPLGNTKSLACLEELIPKGSVVTSCNFFSGEIEFFLSNRDRFFNCKTTKHIIIDCWRSIFEDPIAISEFASSLFPLKYEKEIGIIQENWSSYRSPQARAAIFYVLNNCTEQGWISRGNIDLELLNPVLFSRLRRFRKPENIETVKAESVAELFDQDNVSDILFLRLPKVKINFLSEGLNVGVEEQKINFQSIYGKLRAKPHIILTKPSDLLPLSDCEAIYIDKHGRTTSADNAKEIVIHNVR